jgi:hypothetical protein
MPFKTYTNWLFDGSRTTPIPKATEKVDILKYNSPITHTFALQMFMRHGPLNYYLNKYFNNMGLRYLSKEDLFLFLKSAVLDFRALRRDTVYYPYKPKNKLYDTMRDKFPELKNNDVSLFCDVVENSDDRDTIYETLGLGKPPKKEKIKIGKKQNYKKGKIPVKGFMEKHFSIMQQ